jgi:hypothetical protein
LSGVSRRWPRRGRWSSTVLSRPTVLLRNCRRRQQWCSPLRRNQAPRSPLPPRHNQHLQLSRQQRVRHDLYLLSRSLLRPLRSCCSDVAREAGTATAHGSAKRTSRPRRQLLSHPSATQGNPVAAVELAAHVFGSLPVRKALGDQLRQTDSMASFKAALARTRGGPPTHSAWLNDVGKEGGVSPRRRHGKKIGAFSAECSAE